VAQPLQQVLTALAGDDATALTEHKFTADSAN
jgi:hypothetical protein